MKSSFIKLGIGACLAGLGLVLLDALWLEKYYFQIRQFHIGDRKSRKKIRILLLTDLHFKKQLQGYDKRLANKINSINPDLILLAGDIIDQNGTPGPARSFFGLLNPFIPKIAIPGNHDIKNDVSRGTLKRIIEQYNGRLLVNETTQLNISEVPVTVTGLDDFIEGEACFKDAVKNTGEEKHHFLLVHSPLQHKTALRQMHLINQERSAGNQLNIQYVFAGHNHGGQVRIGSFVPVLPMKSGNYVNGWYNKEKPWLYVSRGFGTARLPFRFGARSEITLFHYGV
jgi:uncharacterized protein